MNRLLKSLINFFGLWGFIYSLLPIFIGIAGIVFSSLVVILAAFFIAVAVILWRSYVRCIRKPQWSREQVCGTYKVDGVNLVRGVPYSGLLTIEKKDKAFECTWEIGAGATEIDPSEECNEGIGLHVGNAIAFSYTHTGKGGDYTGVVLYEIIGDKVMSGQWTRSDRSNVSTEKCVKQ